MTKLITVRPKQIVLNHLINWEYHGITCSNKGTHLLVRYARHCARALHISGYFIQLNVNIEKVTSLIASADGLETSLKRPDHDGQLDDLRFHDLKSYQAQLTLLYFECSALRMNVLLNCLLLFLQMFLIANHNARIYYLFSYDQYFILDFVAENFNAVAAYT